MLKARIFFLLPILLVFFPAKVASSCDIGDSSFTYAYTYAQGYIQSYTYSTSCFIIFSCSRTGYRQAYRTATGYHTECCDGYSGSSCTDTQDPVITSCPQNQDEHTTHGIATATATWIPPSASDNSGSQTLTWTHSPGDSFDIGSTTVTYTSTDAEGNTATCSFYIHVYDREDPVIIDCPGNQIVQTISGLATATVSWIPPHALDNSGSRYFTSSHNPGDSFNIGTTSVFYEVTDDAGNSDNCTFNVVVLDSESPVIVGCPADQSATTSDGMITAIVSWVPPTITDNSGSVTFTYTHNSGDAFSIGTTIVTYTSRDATGNMNTCTFNIVVTDVNECFTYPCFNGGACINTIGSFSCDCILGWSGALCDTGASLFLISLRIMRQYTAGLMDSTTTEYQTLASEITTILLSILGNTIPSSEKYHLHIAGFKPGSVVVNVNVNFVDNRRTTADNVEILRSAIALMANGTTFEVDLSSVTIASADECFPASWQSLYGVVHFESGPLHSWINSSSICPWYTLRVGAPVARAFCSRDGNSAAYWLPEDNCGGNITLDKQLMFVEEFGDLIDAPEAVLNLVVSITQESAQLTSSGVEAIVRILEEVDNIQETTQEIADAIVAVIGNLAAMDESQLETAQEETRAVSRATQTLENILLNLDVPASETFRTVKENVAVQVINVASDAASSGFAFASVGDVNQAFDDSTITQLSINDYQDSIGDGDQRREQTAVIVIPPAVVDGASGNNIVLTIYRDDALFVQNSADINDDVINTNVIAASIGDRARTSTKLTVPVNITLAHKQTNATNPRCVFWDYSANAWSTEGCWLVHSHRYETGCSCDHLTNFAVIMQEPPMDKFNTVYIYIGCSLALVGLLATMAVYLSDRTLRRTQSNQILMCLCGSLLGLYVSFLVMLAVDRRRGEAELPRGACGFLASLLHFCSLSTFSWIGVEGANMYLIVVKAMNPNIPRFMPKAAAIAWGVPAVIVIVTGASANQQYAYTDYCFIRKWPLIGGLLVELALILAANAVIFGLVMYRFNRLTSASADSSRGTAMPRLQNAVIILFLLGFTWVAGYLTVTDDVNIMVHIIFTTLNCLQGFFMFVLYVLRLPKVRDWLAGRSLDNDHSVTMITGDSSQVEIPMESIRNQ